MYRCSIAMAVLALMLSPLAGATEGQRSAAAPKSEPAAKTGQADPNRIVREGVSIQFSVHPATAGADKVVAADWADVSFRITDAKTHQPIRGRYPAAWMDLGQAWEAKGERPMSCRDRISTYLKGIVGVRPMIDLNSHFLLVLTRDASISVIDPAVGISGITNLFAQVSLERPGADWVKSSDDKRLFVTMPLAGKVALVDGENFKVTATLVAGEQPTRAKLQNDERYLWVGNNASSTKQSGVTVIDTAKGQPVAFIPTGAGHHEIAFSEDDRYAFVSNRDAGSVTVVDIRTLKRVKDIKTGEQPISLAFSPLGKAIYVADGQDGTITAIDSKTVTVRSKIKVAPGLGPLRFVEAGRWGLAVNPLKNKVFVIDAATNTLAHAIEAGKEPYQVTFTRNFAYIRSLGTERVGLIPLSELGKPGMPPVTYVQAGGSPPGSASEISIADSIVPSAKEAAAYIVNPGDGTVHFYMEGMAAPMGTFRNYGHEARAIQIMDRSLREREPGLYTGRVKIPVPGSYDVAFMMDTPRFLHCFGTQVEPNPDTVSSTARPAIEYQITERMVPAGSSTTLKFKLTEPNGEPAADIPDLTVLYYGSDGRGRTVVPATALGKGLYQATVKVETPATYYVFVGSSSRNLRYSDLPFASLMGIPAKTGKAAK